MQMGSPKAADRIFHSRLTPVALLNMLEAFQLRDKPARQSFGIALRFMWCDLGLDLTTLVRKKTAKFEHGTAADIRPLRAHLFGMDEIQSALQIKFQIELWMRLESQSQDMTRRRQINIADHKRAGAAAAQPFAILFQQNDILRWPFRSWAWFGIVTRQAFIT